MGERPRLCGNCEHWGKPGEAGEAAEFRTCRAVEQDTVTMPDDYEVMNVTGDGYFEEELIGAGAGDLDPWELEVRKAILHWRNEHKAAVNAGSHYCADLRTREDFGCVLWSPRP